MNLLVASLLGAFFFGAAGYLGSLLGTLVADRLPTLPDGPPAQKPPIAALIAACAVIGATVIPRATSQGQILLIALVCIALVAIWITDSRRGIVPDLFTLVPLGIMVLVGVWQHQWWLLISAALPFIPFAITAALSRGRGMGWGDVKLVALGGAVLGAQMAVLAFALACLAAVAVNYMRGYKRGPIAFAPYLAAAIGVAIPIGILH